MPRLSREKTSTPPQGASQEPLDPAAWHERLMDARSREEVVEMLREFVAAWPLDAMHRLPFACLPPPLDTPEDVITYSLKLAAFDRDIVRPASSELLRMSDVFSFAALLMKQLPAGS